MKSNEYRGATKRRNRAIRSRNCREAWTRQKKREKRLRERRLLQRRRQLKTREVGERGKGEREGGESSFYQYFTWQAIEAHLHISISSTAFIHFTFFFIHSLPLCPFILCLIPVCFQSNARNPTAQGKLLLNNKLAI